MARINPSEAGGANVVAFLDMLAHSEMGAVLLAKSDDGYNVIVGSTPSKPILFDSYTSHPNRLISPPTIKVASTAAGRYQLLSRYYGAYAKQLGLSNFGPINQDRIAIQQIRECKALVDVQAGRFEIAVTKVAHIWASLPGAGYGQHENKLSDLKQAYLAAGGKVCAA